MDVQEALRREALPRTQGAVSWLVPDLLASLTDINDQYLELASFQARSSISGLPALLVELRELFTALNAPARRRAAACPYLLVDVGFADAQRWQWVFSSRPLGQAQFPRPFHTLPQTAALLRLVLTFSWHVARTHKSAAPMLLGMAPRTAEVLARYTFRQIADLAESYPRWLQPRWPGHPYMWRELLRGALKGESAFLDQARLRGVQLLAAEVRAGSGIATQNVADYSQP